MAWKQPLSQVAEEAQWQPDGQGAWFAISFAETWAVLCAHTWSKQLHEAKPYLQGEMHNSSSSEDDQEWGKQTQREGESCEAYGLFVLKLGYLKLFSTLTWEFLFVKENLGGHK